MNHALANAKITNQAIIYEMANTETGLCSSWQIDYPQIGLYYLLDAAKIPAFCVRRTPNGNLFFAVNSKGEEKTGFCEASTIAAADLRVWEVSKEDFEFFINQTRHRAGYKHYKNVKV